MDFVWYRSPCTAVLGALAITLLSILVTLAVRTRRLSSLPGPYTAWNILGSLYYIKTKGVVEYDTECKKKYGKLYGDWEGSLYTVFTTDVDIIREVFFKEARTFHSSLMQFYPSNELQKNALPFIYEYGRWKRVRSIVTPQFSSARLRQMTPFMKVSISNVINNFNTAADEGSSLDIKKMFGAYTMRLISSAGFGMDVDPANEPNHPFVRNAGDAISSFLGNPVTVLSSVFPLLRPIVRMLSPLNRVAPSVHYIDSVLTAAIDERRTNGQSGLKDILQSLIDARLPEDEVSAQEVTFGDITVKKTLSDVEIRGQSIAFFLAGYETTATTLTFMSYLLATNPDVQDRLCQEIDNVLKGTEPDYDSLHKLTYLEMCLHETMRLFPPILRLSRSASEDTSVKGYFIRRGTGISVPVYTLHRDPDYWPEPEKFDPERFAPGNREKIHPCAHMPFSAGPRHCVGKRMALVAAKMAMASVLQHVTFSPSQQTKAPVVLEKGNFMCAAEGGIVLDVKRRT